MRAEIQALKAQNQTYKQMMNNINTGYIDLKKKYGNTSSEEFIDDLENLIIMNQQRVVPQKKPMIKDFGTIQPTDFKYFENKAKAFKKLESEMRSLPSEQLTQEINYFVQSIDHEMKANRIK